MSLATVIGLATNQANANNTGATNASTQTWIGRAVRNMTASVSAFAQRVSNFVLPRLSYAYNTLKTNKGFIFVFGLGVVAALYGPKAKEAFFGSELVKRARRGNAAGDATARREAPAAQQSAAKHETTAAQQPAAGTAAKHEAPAAQQPAAAAAAAASQPAQS